MKDWSQLPFRLISTVWHGRECDYEKGLFEFYLFY